MFTTILVPLDGTPEGAAALPLAEMLAGPRHSTLTLVRVAGDYHGPALAEARDYLSCFVAGLEARGRRVRAEVRHGDTAEEIAAAASGAAADLIVMVTHGRDGVARAWFGSVTDGVLARTECPLLVLRADSTPVERLRTILVPLDGSPGSAAALALARSLALMTDARLALVQVVPPLPRWGRSAAADPAWEEETLRAVQGRLDGLARDLIGHGLPAVGLARVGPPAGTIAAVAGEVDADLIVMTTRGLTGAKRAVLGSVADEVVRTAGRPTLLVRPADAGWPGAAPLAVDGLDEARPDIIPAPIQRG